MGKKGKELLLYWGFPLALFAIALLGLPYFAQATKLAEQNILVSSVCCGMLALALGALAGKFCIDIINENMSSKK